MWTLDKLGPTSMTAFRFTDGEWKYSLVVVLQPVISGWDEPQDYAAATSSSIFQHKIIGLQ